MDGRALAVGPGGNLATGLLQLLQRAGHAAAEQQNQAPGQHHGQKFYDQCISGAGLPRLPHGGGILRNDQGDAAFRQNDRSGAQQGMIVRQHHARLAILGKQGFHFG